jgi:hypothetical protein
MNNSSSMMLRVMAMNNSDTVVSQFQGDTITSQEKEEIDFCLNL